MCPIGSLMDRQDAVHAMVSAAKLEVPVEDVPLGKSTNRILGCDVRCKLDLPPFDRSLRDGYAVRSDDLMGASSGSPSFLNVVGEVPVGGVPDFKIPQQGAAVIHTGGMLPDGADCVAMLEDTSLVGSILEVRRALQRGENVVFKGEEAPAGSVVLGRGTLLSEAHVGLLASQGIKDVPCLGLRSCVFSSGDEIKPVGEAIPYGMLYDVNGWFICSALSRIGIESSYGGILEDRAVNIREKIRDAMEWAHVIIISGGSSISVRDHLEEVFSTFDHPGLIVRGINVQPGKPLLGAVTGSPARVVLGLPGHPLSCATSFYTFVTPMLEMMFGGSGWNVKTLKISLAEDLPARSGIEEFVPGKICDDGVVPIFSASSYSGVLANCDGLIRVPKDRETLRRRETVDLWMIR
ncbi:molybdopterin biosynthesis enzyme [Thermanaerovibrio velox DSM 12556]|uniref:Molybdopterin molybdenumtransferase n=1 Tax=Thermanaerovibrio velox DSM 12556 TaxID=926567 RepID=H0URS0_9BACT|nr:molybdopterin molybdotransferase MoeA [Thermanaerovibrio velox]EHM10009.1 molybdopterin biosynthesis enzyme [Thermanaerovibrio velox DSM 12556]